MSQNSSEPKVTIKNLKPFADQNLTGSLRGVILLEKDELTPAEFLSKVEVWLTLLRLEGDRR